MLPKKNTPESRRVMRGLKTDGRLSQVFRAGLFLVAIHGLIAGYALVAPVRAAEPIDSDKIQTVVEDPTLPWQLEADEITYDQNLDQYLASGNVLIYKANIKLMANQVRFDQKNRKANAWGDVVLTNGEDILSGTRMEIDLDTQTGFVEDGYLFIKESNYHLTGDRIEKIGKRMYAIDEATVTTCDGDNPDWRITGKKVRIREDGQGTARHVKLYARNMPVLYTPYFYYPARKKRQTGLLWPEGGVSDRWGYYYNQPFFWAIDRSSDATFYAEYMSSRGFRPGLEYRYYLDQYSKGTWMVDGFVDRKIDDGIGDASDNWGFEDGDKDILRKNRDRYWLRGSHHQQLPADFRARLDIDLVSDQDYTRDFKNGYMGWKASKDYFEEVFNRDLSDYNDPIRKNLLNFSRVWPDYSLNAEFDYYLNSNIRNSHEPDTTLQQLPLVSFDAVKQRITDSSFFYNLNTQYVYYWSRDGMRTQRVNAQPRVYLPLQFKPFISIEPSVGLLGTLWYLDKKEFNPENDKQFYQRGLYDARLDLFTEFYRVFDTGDGGIERLKHTVRPRIAHEYIPKVDQDDLPNFDSIDRIEERNLVTYSLTNSLTSKSRKRGSFDITRRRDDTRASVIDSEGDYEYNDFLRFALEQSYDINEATGNDPYRPFSPINARLDVYPGKYFSVSSDALWSVYDYEFLSNNLALNLWDNRGDRFLVQYRYTKLSDEIDLSETDSIYTDLRVKVSDALSLTANFQYNFLDKTDVQTGFGIFYRSQCWSIETNIVQQPNDMSFMIKIHLFGLGEFGI